MCVKENITPCENTSWSSYSPDPKSNLGEVIQATGTIGDPYRINILNSVQV